MFIVFENNPQFYKVGDQFKLFSKVEAAARYAINRGLTSAYFKDYKSLEALLGKPGDSVTGGTMPNPQITITNLDPVDGVDAPVVDTKAVEAEVAKTAAVTQQLLDVQKNSALTEASLDASKKQVADLQAQLAEAKAPKAKKADKAAEPAPAANTTPATTDATAATPAATPAPATK